MPNTLADLRVRKDLLCGRVDMNPGLVRLGATDCAQPALGAMVVDVLAEPGGTVTGCGASTDIGSTKSLNDLTSPINETVCDVINRTPRLVDTEPYRQGWVFEVKVDPSTLNQQLISLMGARTERSWQVNDEL
jgi:glycine cleavage system H protein